LKERDFFKLNYTRLQQELKKFHEQQAKERKKSDDVSKEISRLNKEIQNASKEKMLAQLDRDKLSSKLGILENALKDLKTQKSSKSIKSITTEEPKPAERQLPEANATYSLRHAFSAHSQAVSSLRFHPHKMILATVSDDKHWKFWSFPSSEVVASGYGHYDWLSDCDFSSDGTLFATCSGDATARIWKVGYQSAQTETLKPYHVLKEHTQVCLSKYIKSTRLSGVLFLDLVIPLVRLMRT
jgi:WD40 repeat protein